MFSGCHHGGPPPYDFAFPVLFFIIIGAILIRKPQWFPDYPLWAQLKKPPVNGMFGWFAIIFSACLAVLLIAAAVNGCTES